MKQDLHLQVYHLMSLEKLLGSHPPRYPRRLWCYYYIPRPCESFAPNDTNPCVRQIMVNDYAESFFHTREV